MKRRRRVLRFILGLGLLLFLIKKLYDSVVSTFSRINERLESHYKSILDLGFSRDMFKRDILGLKKKDQEIDVKLNELENKIIEIETNCKIQIKK